MQTIWIHNVQLRVVTKKNAREKLMDSTTDVIGRALAVVDLALRDVFPDTYWKRCTYAAAGLNHLLALHGIASDFVSGDLLCFTLSRDGKHPKMEGYGNGQGGAATHFWVQTPDELLDLGVHYLPKEARDPIVAMPVIRWAVRHPLPLYLRYREVARAPVMRPDPSIAAALTHFIQECETRDRTFDEAGAPPSWVLMSPTSLQKASQRGDIWARGAAQFEGWVDPRSLPF